VVSSSDAAYDLIIKNNKKYGLDLKEYWKKEEENTATEKPSKESKADT
jgi:hypothetical protein